MTSTSVKNDLIPLGIDNLKEDHRDQYCLPVSVMDCRIPTPQGDMHRRTKSHDSSMMVASPGTLAMLCNVRISDRYAFVSSLSMMDVSLVSSQNPAKTTKPRAVDLTSPWKTTGSYRGRSFCVGGASANEAWMVKGTPRPMLGVPPTLTAKWQPAPGINGVVYYDENQNCSLDNGDSMGAGNQCMSPVNHQGKTILCDKQASAISLFSPIDESPPREKQLQSHDPAASDLSVERGTYVKQLFGARQGKLLGEEYRE